mgnify:CR=1 FL=1
MRKEERLIERVWKLKELIVKVKKDIEDLEKEYPKLRHYRFELNTANDIITKIAFELTEYLTNEITKDLIKVIDK